MTKTLNQIIFFFLHQNQNIFFSNIGNQNIFLEKNHTPLQVKWSFPNFACGQVESTSHFLISCNKYTDLRNELRLLLMLNFY